MARCLCCSVGLLCVWVVAVCGSDAPIEAEAPVPIRRLAPRTDPPQPPQPTPVLVVPTAPASLPVPSAACESAGLTPAQHLRRAAEHLEAAATGPHAEELCDQAAQLRATAEQLERETARQLANLRQQLAKIQAEIRTLEQLAPQSQQVQVSITMLEVDAALLQELGLTMHLAAEPHSDLVEKFVSAGHGTILPAVIPCESAESLVEALRKAGAAKVLSSPQIITMSGRPATIDVGGEFPVPLPRQTGCDSVEWRPFGIRAEVVPQILDNGRLKLDVASEVSERDFSRCATIGNHQVPAVTTRRINTQVEMEFGQSLAVGGLTSRTGSPADSHAPPVAGVPVPRPDRHVRAVSHEELPQAKTLIVLVTPRRVPRLDP